jgi:IS5 family transposase
MGQPGPVSDISICRKTLNKFDNKQRFKGDKAYIGEPQILTPTKKPKNRELTESQKQNNRALSQERILVEHLIRLVKIFKIIQERFRLNKKRYKSILSTICGLVRLRLGSLILEVIKSPETGETIDVIMAHLFSTKMDVAGVKSD